MVLEAGKSKIKELVDLVFAEVLPGSSAGKESTCQCGRCEFDHWVGEIPREGNGNPIQYSCLGNFMDRGAWLATVLGVAKESDTT